MKIHNPSNVDIAEIPQLNASLKAGDTMEVTEEVGAFMLKTWQFLSKVEEAGEVEEAPKMTAKEKKAAEKAAKKAAEEAEKAAEAPKEEVEETA